MVEIDLRYGAHWTAKGASPSGVRPREEVRFDFPAAFPAKAPEFSLRPDFSRNHPHIQPWLGVDDRVIPCVLNGSIGEFLAARGFHDLVAQILDWLQGAAEGRLMNLKQGWEPARRDTYHDVLVADHERLVSLVTPTGGFQFFRTVYGCQWTRDFTSYFWGELKEKETAKAALSEKKFSADSDYGRGEGLAVAVWPGKRADGKPFVCDTYLPDDIATVSDLMQRAKLYGVDASLGAAVALLRARAAKMKPVTFPLAVILMVRRPSRVLGTNSNVEVCSYLTPNILPAGPMADPQNPVRPLAHRDAIEPRLLRSLSGDADTPSWALLGCGSLGSKVAMHAARSGNAPAIAADRAKLAPHNAARHALYPIGDTLAAGWLSPKAEALATALAGFRKPVRALCGDHVALATDLAAIRGKVAKPKWLVNTTASLVVRESLVADAFRGLPRVVEMSLFDGAQIGYVGIEGLGHNPNSVELVAALYQQASTDDALRTRLLLAENVVRAAIGQGCGSLTMVASDAAISVVAAGMSEIFSALDIASPGRIELLQRDGFAMGHTSMEVPPFRRVSIDGLDGWTLSVSEAVHDRILEEKARHPRDETGGVLVGWSSSLAKRMVVTDLIDAPADSRRSPTEFVLGVAGLSDAVDALHARSGGLIRCLGTWHSHLGAAEPSPTDKNSVTAVGAHDALPVAFLISGVDGLRAIGAPPTAGKATAQQEERA